MATLYRKYRPQNFAEIVGQNHIKITLEHEIASNKIAHAYLFCGPRAVGKTTISRVLAKAVNCQNRKEGEHEPCDKCQMCLQIIAGRSLDVIEIDAASHTGVDNVRENIIAASRVMPVQAKYKIFIIDEVHMLSISAFNALLKIIEEPPEYIIFILCTTEVHKVPTTIISRCQRFDFKRISVNEITNKLQYIVNKEGVSIDKSILESIARQSEGHMRDAESLLGQVISIGGKEVTAEEADLVIPRSNLSEAINLIDFMARKDAGSAIGLVNKLLDEGINLPRFLSDTIELLRKLMLAKLNPILAEKLGLSIGESLEANLSKASHEITLNQAILFIERLAIAKNEIKNSFIMQLPVEVAIAELCTASEHKSFLPARPTPPSSPPNTVQYKQALPGNQGSSGISGGVNKELLISRWNEVLAKVKKYNHSLSLILRVCQPVGLNGNQLCIAFKYKFHKDRINENSIKKIVENVLQEVYGTPLIVEAVIDENLQVTPATQTSPLSSPLATPASAPGSSTTNEATPNYAKDEAKKEAEKEDEKTSDKKNDSMIDNLLKTFGGKIVN